MTIKKGDTIQVRAGKDRGKTGKVLRVVNDGTSLLIEGINVYIKHTRPKQQGEKGEKVTLPRPIPLSRANLYCSHCGRGVRFGVRIEGDNKTRYCKRCKSTL